MHLKLIILLLFLAPLGYYGYKIVYFKSLTHDDVNLSILEEYELEGVVLAIKDYSWGKNTIFGSRTAIICPIDMAIINDKDQLALGSKELLERFNMVMGFRRATFYPNRIKKGDIKIDITTISNNHLVIKCPKLLKNMLKTKPGDKVHIGGYLVDIRFKDKTAARRYWGPNNLRINSSVSREDKGDGACEVILVERFKNLGPIPPTNP